LIFISFPFILFFILSPVRAHIHTYIYLSYSSYFLLSRFKIPKPTQLYILALLVHQPPPITLYACSPLVPAPKLPARPRLSSFDISDFDRCDLDDSTGDRTDIANLDNQIYDTGIYLIGHFFSLGNLAATSIQLTHHISHNCRNARNSSHEGHQGGHQLSEPDCPGL
jgi:hypothetical protein